MLEADENVPGLELLDAGVENGGGGSEGVGLERWVGEIWVDAGALLEGVGEEDAIAGICGRGRSLSLRQS